MTWTRRSILFGAAAAGASVILPRPATASGSRVGADAIMADLELLRAAYATVHPGLTRYLAPGAFDARIEAAKRIASQGMELGAFFLVLARLTAAVRCGHSYPNPNNQGRAARAALFQGRDRTPFAFRWVEGRMIVTGPRGPNSLLMRGSEVLAIDGVPAEQLRQMMMPLARADGGNDAKRVAQLGLDPRERYSAFDVYRPMLAQTPSDGRITLRMREPRGRERTIEVPALTESELQEWRGESSGLGWQFEIGPDAIGRLTMPDWVTYNSDWNWQAFLDEVVDRLIDQRALGLIVDIRGNEGGTECGWHLLERFVGRDTPLPAFVKKVRYRRLPEALRGALDTWDDSFRDWGASADGPDEQGFYRLRRLEENIAIVRPRGRRFAAPVVVLVDAACSSATFQFANAVAASRVATLVGEPTGGNRRGINGDAYFFVRLPGSGLEVDLPIVGMFAAEAQPDAGVQPSLAVPVTAVDIAAGRDRQMEAAVAHLRRL